MLGFGKKEKELKDDKTLYCPLTGKVINIEETSDPVFAKKIMGDGFAVEPADGRIYAPVSGIITLLQGHAVGITRADGLEVLLHIGIDTVSLSDNLYNFNVKAGDNVGGGEEIGTVDFAAIEAAGLEKTTMIVFTNTNDKLSNFTVDYAAATGGEAIGTANVKG
jgi:PTS system beta-glucosides-specific IIA component